jgi:hypothetical protein
LSKHTPGPWYVVNPNESLPHYVCTDPKRPLETEVAVLYGPNVAGNSSLIAAVPDLLDALRRAQAWIHSDVCGSAGCHQDCVSARSAIAKAEGSAR